MARQRGERMNPAERAQASVKALGMMAQGGKRKDVAAALGVSEKTVTALVKDAPEHLGIGPEQKAVLRAQVISRLTDVQGRCYDALEAKHTRATTPDRTKHGSALIKGNSFNFVPILQTLMQADERLVKLLGLAEPEEVTVNLTTAADRVKAYRDRVAARRASFEALDGGKAPRASGE